ncbi:ABC transporter permease [Bacillus shivajii]|uniref:ABC transporter permease n=1 Tax=Bacillus shivajii TaxID=1983719 RepID=UPI001CFA1001|nr:ABC transporter permease subunit [Bacillus shivajii]UCZ52519.1 ABC transporter permease [Bacillus shivajii]
MNQWMTLFKKEIKESVRNFKWVWIPLVFLLLGIMQPVTSYFLPDILENFGGLPDGAVINIPLPTGPQVLAETLGQFSQIGLLVLVLAFMGTVASERNNGSIIMVLVKPVSYVSYLTAKWAHMTLLALSSFIVGFGLSVYYTFLLIEPVAASDVIKGMLIYSLWILFIVTLVLCLSALLKSTAATAFISIGVTIVLNLLSSFVPDLMRWSPGMLMDHTQLMFHTGGVGEFFLLSILVTVLIIITMMTFTCYVFQRKEMAIHTT